MERNPFLIVALSRSGIFWLGITAWVGTAAVARAAAPIDCVDAYSLLAGNSQDLLQLQGSRVTLSDSRRLELGEAIGRNGSTALVFEVKEKIQEAEAVIKIPRSRFQRSSLAEELRDTRQIEASGIVHSRVLESDPSGAYIVSERVRGVPGSVAVERKLSLEQARSLADTFRKARKHQIALDLKPDNFVWDEARRQMILVDRGLRHNTLPSQINQLENWLRIFFRDNTAGEAEFRRIAAQPD